MENTYFQTASNQSSQTKRALLGQASMFEVIANRSFLTALIRFYLAVGVSPTDALSRLNSYRAEHQG